MKLKTLVLIITISWQLPSFAQSQVGLLDLTNPDQVHILVGKKGERFIGRIIAIKENDFVFKPKGYKVPNKF